MGNVELSKEMAEHGLMVYRRAGAEGFTLLKLPTTLHPQEDFDWSGQRVRQADFGSYAEAMSVARRLMGKKDRGRFFSAYVRFDRGLGWEVIRLPGVQAVWKAEAQALAEKQATEYFLSREDLMEHKWSEVRICPGSVE